MIPYYSVDPNLVGNINLGDPVPQRSFRAGVSPTVRVIGAGYTGYPPNVNLPLNFQTNYAGQAVGPGVNATNNAPGLAEQAREYYQKNVKGTSFGNRVDNARNQASRQFNVLTTRPGLYAQTIRPQGAGLGAVMTAGGELLEGNVVGGLVGGGVGLATAGLTNRLVGGLATTAARFLPGPLRVPAMLAGKTVVPYLAGEAVTRTVANTIQGAPQAAEQTAQNVSSAVPATLSTMLGVQGFLDTVPGMADVDNIFYKGRRVRESKEREFQRGETRKDLEAQRAERTKELELGYQLQTRYLDDAERRNRSAMAQAQGFNQANLRLQRDIALQLSRENAVQGQALLNTQGAISQGLLRTQGAIQLAGIGMQTGASMVNTFLANSPYTKGIMASPTVSFNL